MEGSLGQRPGGQGMEGESRLGTKAPAEGEPGQKPGALTACVEERQLHGCRPASIPSPVEFRRPQSLSCAELCSHSLVSGEPCEDRYLQ